jgi:hypothetical protein
MEMTTTTKKPVGLRGKELLRAAVNQIIQHPETWNQFEWHCGTGHCIGGWCEVLSGDGVTDKAGIHAEKLLGISHDDANWLFAGNRTLGEIYAYAKATIAGKEYFDRDGFDRAGFNRAWFNCAGFDRDGFDRDGFNRDGFNRDGKKMELL